MTNSVTTFGLALGKKNFVGSEGFEPSANGLKGRCSTG